MYNINILPKWVVTLAKMHMFEMYVWIKDKMRKNRLRWFGHITHRPTNTLIKRWETITMGQKRKTKADIYLFIYLVLVKIQERGIHNKRVFKRLHILLINIGELDQWALGWCNVRKLYLALWIHHPPCSITQIRVLC